MRKKNVLPFRFDDELKTFIDAECESLGISSGEFVRQCILYYKSQKNALYSIIDTNKGIKSISTQSTNIVTSTRNYKKKGEKTSEPKKSRKSYQQFIDNFPTLDLEEFRKVWERWEVDRKVKLTERSALAQLKKLSLLAPHKAVECVEHSLMNNYQGIFPDKFQNNGHTHSTTKGRVTPDDIISDGEEIARRFVARRGLV